jgi:YD repeat-containing protein
MHDAASDQKKIDNAKQNIIFIRFERIIIMKQTHYFLPLIFIFLSFAVGPGIHAAGIEYSYDPLNRLAKTITTSAEKTTTTEYTYDAAGNRTALTTIVENGAADVQTLAGEFGSTDCSTCQTDSDGDGDVDGSDIYFMIH